MSLAGAVDEIQIYARGLNDAEIRTLAGIDIGGDLDGNGTVDGADLGMLLAKWGDCASCCAVDLDGDGVVDRVDLGVLLGNWTGN